MADLLRDMLHEFRRQKELADRAMAQLDDDTFLRRPAPSVNSVAIVVKHLAGNLSSRWTDFLTSDGEKPGRDRDLEFQIGAADTRANLTAAWERGWEALFATLESLMPADLVRTVTIRNESHSVSQALLRGMSHAAYHTGQIVYVVRQLQPESDWLTIAPGTSRSHRGPYLDVQ